MPYSLAFLLHDHEIPSVAIDPDGDTFEAFCKQHPPTDGYQIYAGFEPLVMVRELALTLGLDGIDYFHHACRVLGDEAMNVATESLMAIERFFRERPEDAAVFLRGRLFSKQIVEVIDEFEEDMEEFDGDNIHFYQMLRAIRTSLDHMQRARSSGKRYVYVLGDVTDKISEAIQNVRPATPPYSKAYLLEIERIVEQGVDGASLPFAPPRRDSMTVSNAAKWLRHTVTLLPSMTGDIPSPSERAFRTHQLKGEMRKAAIASLWSPNLAPEFLDGFALPDLDVLLRECGFDTIDDQAAAAIVEKLSTITGEDSRLYPGTIGESIGMQYYTGTQWLAWNGEQWQAVEKA